MFLLPPPSPQRKEDTSTNYNAYTLKVFIGKICTGVYSNYSIFISLIKVQSLYNFANIS